MLKRINNNAYVIDIPTSKYLVSSTFNVKDLSPYHGEEEVVAVEESRTTLFEGGGADVARPTVVTTSWSSTYAKSSWTPKVNPFLCASPLPTLLNGMLLHTP